MFHKNIKNKVDMKRNQCYNKCNETNKLLGGITMNKQQALALFKEVYAEYLKENRNDVIAKNTAWADFTDALMKDGEITESQYENWMPPY